MGKDRASVQTCAQGSSRSRNRIIDYLALKAIQHFEQALLLVEGFEKRQLWIRTSINEMVIKQDFNVENRSLLFT
jgi:hypothetical protein